MFDPKKVANRLKQHLQDAVGDVANDMLHPSGGCVDDNWTKKIKQAKKNKVRDLPGWLADELYNDPDTISDLIGDKLYEETNGDETKKNLVLDVLEENAFPGMKTAIANLRK